MTLTKNARRLVAGAIAAAALPVAIASGAQAHTTSGCKVEPLKPIYAGTNAAGVKIIDYRISVNCSPGRSAHITQVRWEEDGWPNPDDKLGTSTFSVRGVKTVHNKRTLVDTELGKEEVYQKIRFHVHSDNGVVSGNTGWHKSAVLSIYN
ncbi:MAG: hypothetical protein QM711_08325 [Micropruina sp.]|uniref:hypothetical protein n=1 Tax=Micropruina sp. TaxID=2737536 RepID=UPI0039E34AD3